MMQIILRYLMKSMRSMSIICDKAPIHNNTTQRRTLAYYVGYRNVDLLMTAVIGILQILVPMKLAIYHFYFTDHYCQFTGQSSNLQTTYQNSGVIQLTDPSNTPQLAVILCIISYHFNVPLPLTFTNILSY